MNTPTPKKTNCGITLWRHMDGKSHADHARALSAPRKAAFLAELAKVGDAAAARNNLKLSKPTVDGWRNRDAVFKARMNKITEGK